MLVHTNEKPLNFEECNKRFTTKVNFNVHLLVYTVEKSLKCKSITIAYIYVNYAQRTKQTKIPVNTLTFVYFKTNKL